MAEKPLRKNPRKVAPKGAWRTKWLTLFLCSLFVGAGAFAGARVKTSDFRVRDPYVVPCPEDGLYHLFVSDEWSGGVGVSVRTSSDLKTWSEPKKVLAIPDSWNIIDTWAPEVHRFDGKWYVFVTLGRERRDLPAMKLLSTDPDFLRRYGPESFAKRRRLGTYVFRSNELDGPYEPVADESLTPVERMALDGTLWVEDGKPYMVFSWDWPQLGIGECAVAPLKRDLSAFEAEPKTLFRASDIATNAWKANVDGPFLYRSEKSGKLFAIWSTTGLGSDFERGRPVFDGMKDGAYRVILCESSSGRLAGPWGDHRVIFSQNGGHGMFFKSFDGRLVLAIHQPEKWFFEHAAFFSVEDLGDSLAIGGIFESAGTHPAKVLK